MRFQATLIALSLLALSSCRYFRSDANIQIKAIDASGEPLAGANVLVDKKIIGKTDHQGNFKAFVVLPAAEPLLVEVNKPSEDRFYAPYFETIQLKRGDINTFKLNATLYAVSKTGSEPAKAQTEATAAPETPPEPEAQVDGSTAEGNSLAPDAAVGDIPPTLPQAQAEAALPKRTATFYVGSGNDFVAAASLYIGDKSRHQWVEGCTTNIKGRCSVDLPLQQDRLSVLVRAKGFQTLIKSFDLDADAKVRFEMLKGRSIEVFAISAEQMSGIEGIRVADSKKSWGVTDAFGSLVIPADALEPNASLNLEHELWIPSQIKRSIPEQPVIIQHYQPLKPKAVRVAVLPLQRYQMPEGQLREWEQPMGDIASTLEKAGAEVLGSEELAPILKGQTLANLAERSWKQSSLDFIIRPALLNAKVSYLVLSAIGSDGNVVAAVAKEIPANSQVNLLQLAAKDLLRDLPNEGTILEAAKDDFRINLGAIHGLTKGSTLKILGPIRNASGDMSPFGQVAEAIAFDVKDERSLIRIIDRKAGAQIETGNRVVPIKQQGQESRKTQLSVRNESEGLGQADAFANGLWIGSSTRDGRLMIDEMPAQTRLLILRPGYAPKSLNPEELTTPNITLEHDRIAIRIDSTPGSALVKMNDRELGRTPLDMDIPFPGKNVKLELSMDGYKAFTRQIELSDSGLHLIGNDAPSLEKDPRQLAERLLQEGKSEEAAKVLAETPESDPAYLYLQHTLGEIYLNRLYDPIKAAEAFHRVTSRVANYADKRFIGTYINEAVALYEAAEKTVTHDRNLSVSYWRQAVSILNQTEEELRNVPSEQYPQAAHTLFFYRALSSHKLWKTTQAPEDKTLASKQWKDYIQGIALSLPHKRHEAWIKQAESYYQELQSQSQARKAINSSSIEM